MSKKPPKQATPEEEAAQTVQLASMAEALEDYEQFAQARAQEIWQYEDTGHHLNLEEQLFVRSYIIDRNEIAALRRLGHRDEDISRLRNRAKKMLAKPEVASAVEFLAKRMMDRLEITADRVQRQIAAVAFFDPRQVMTFDQYGVNLLNSKFWTPEQAAAIQSIEMGQNGIKIKMYDRLRAAEMLAKQIGVQPEEGDEAARSARDAAEALTKIGQVIDRVFAPELPAPEDAKRIN